MYKKLKYLLALLLVGIFTASVSAHTPMLYVEDYGDGTIFLEGGFSDGSSAAGTEILLIEDSDFDQNTTVRDQYLEFVYNSNLFAGLGDYYINYLKENKDYEFLSKEGLIAESFSELEEELYGGKLVIFRAELDDFSTLNLPKPEGEYLVIFNAGPGHEVKKNGPLLTEEEKAFLE